MNVISKFVFFLFLELASTYMWTELEYAKNFEPYTQFEDNCARIYAPDVNCEEFIKQFEAPYIPCVITNIQEGWKAQSKWVSIIQLLYFTSI